MIKLKNTEGAMMFGRYATPRQIGKVYLSREKFRSKYKNCLKSKEYDRAVYYGTCIKMMSEVLIGHKQDPEWLESMKVIGAL